jgi:RHS repeat-associated protein
VTVPTYDSAGVLRRREHRKLFTPAAPPQDSETVLYFAGRPVATLRLTPSTSALKYLTTDHLGTPILATGDTGALVWQGGFEPFGADWNGATAAGVFLRFPGQWVDGLWEGGRLSSEMYYNVHRWYGWGTGRYLRPDPLFSSQLLSTYLYADARSSVLMDSLGLYAVKNHRSEHFATGAPKFKPDRVDADFSCTCCSSGAQSWCLKFNVDLTSVRLEVEWNQSVSQSGYFSLGSTGLQGA